MRCSACSAPVKPIVSLDIDGTLGDYHGHFQSFAQNYLGRPVRQDRYDYTCPYPEWLGLDKTTYREVKLAYRQGGLKRSMPAFTGASWLTQGLSARGAEVWIATTRPYLRLDNIDPDTRHWLERNEIHYDAMIYGEEKYQKLIEQVDSDRIVGVVDDLPEQLEHAIALGIPSWLARQGHAEHVWKPFRCFDSPVQMTSLFQEVRAWTTASH